MLVFLILFAFALNRLGADCMAFDIAFQHTKPTPKYTTYVLKSLTLKTEPYTNANTLIDSRFESPNQKLPRAVLANLSLVLDVAVNHQALLVLQPYFRELIIIIMVVFQCFF